MADDQKGVEAPKEKEAQDLPMTAEDFQNELDNLVKRAKAAGVRPLRLMTGYLGKQSMGIIDSFLAHLEADNGKEKKK